MKVFVLIDRIDSVGSPYLFVSRDALIKEVAKLADTLAARGGVDAVDLGYLYHALAAGSSTDIQEAYLKLNGTDAVEIFENVELARALYWP